FWVRGSEAGEERERGKIDCGCGWGRPFRPALPPGRPPYIPRPPGWGNSGRTTGGGVRGAGLRTRTRTPTRGGVRLFGRRRGGSAFADHAGRLLPRPRPRPRPGPGRGRGRGRGVEGGGLGRERAALVVVEHADGAVLAVVAGGDAQLAGTDAADGLGEERPAGAVQVLERRVAQQVQLGAESAEQARVLALDPAALRAHAEHGAEHLVHRHERAVRRRAPRHAAAVRRRGGRPRTVRPVRQLLDAREHAPGHRLAARGAAPFPLARLRRREPHAARAVPVEVVLPLLREELDRAEEARG